VQFSKTITPKCTRLELFSHGVRPRNSTSVSCLAITITRSELPVTTLVCLKGWSEDLFRTFSKGTSRYPSRRMLRSSTRNCAELMLVLQKVCSEEHFRTFHISKATSICPSTLNVHCVSSVSVFRQTQSPLHIPIPLSRKCVSSLN
jgi:hypothetical protein